VIGAVPPPPVAAAGGGGTVVEITLPEWAASDDNVIAGMYARRYATDDEMMSLAIRMSDTNVKMGTGGPFGAAIFERVRRRRRPTSCGGGEENEGEGEEEEEEEEYCTLVSVGMNRVVPLNNSTLHAEMVAIQIAQSKLGSFTLSDMKNDGRNASNDNNRRKFELFTSCEPCAMCLGGTLWSGVSRLVTGATKDDAQSIGFDEGPVNDESYAHLENAGITVTRNVMRDEAADVLRRYGRGGVIYNRCPSSVVDG